MAKVPHASSNEKQKDFLNRILRRGGEDRHESKPRKCCKGDDGTLQNEDNERVFQLSPTPQQVASYFSRMPNLQKNNVAI